MSETSPVTTPTTHRSIGAIWKIESARLIAGLTRMVRDVGLAEELAQDALLVALEQWPVTGLPDKPGAWLMAVAKRRGIDQLRRKKLLDRKHEELQDDLEVLQGDVPAETDEIGDDLLRLVLIACHPVLATEARIALTLRLLGGFATEQIARAFLASESAIAQRIVRAKRALTEARASFEAPAGQELAVRLASVMDVIYLIFNEGYVATAGDDWLRPALCEEALRLGRMLAQLTPLEPEVHGLVALMELQASRLSARVGPSGEPILLLDQDRTRWDHLLITRGLAALDLAHRLGGVSGQFALQAAIASCHARARTAQDTEWGRIAALYDELAELTASPVVELNRAVAVAMARGPQEGLRLTDELLDEPSLRDYALLPTVRGDLLEKLGRFDDAHAQFKLAAELTRNAREKSLLLSRVEQCAQRARTCRLRALADCDHGRLT